jgi:hypothetical protein
MEEKLCTQCGLPGKFVMKKNKKLSKKSQEFKFYYYYPGECNKCRYKNALKRENLKVAIYG